jgi:hypothetical protein
MFALKTLNGYVIIKNFYSWASLTIKTRMGGKLLIGFPWPDLGPT